MRRTALALALTLPSGVFAASVQDQAQFEAAVHDTSTASFYVLVTIVDDRTGQTRTACTNINSLKGALHRDLHLSYDDASIRRVDRIMLKNRGHIFHFSDPGALSDTVFFYTSGELEEARAFVQSHRDEIAAHRLGGPRMPERMQRSAAFACALIERGYQAGIGDRNPIIFWSR